MWDPKMGLQFGEGKEGGREGGLKGERLRRKEVKVVVVDERLG